MECSTAKGALVKEWSRVPGYESNESLSSDQIHTCPIVRKYVSLPATSVVCSHDPDFPAI